MAAAGQVALLILVIVTIAAGHAGRDLLALHIPAAIGTVGLAVRQVVIAGFASRASGTSPLATGEAGVGQGAGREPADVV